MKNANTSLKSLNSQGKGKKYRTQIEIIFKYLNSRIATATMVSVATGIPQKCITRHKRKLELRGSLQETVYKPCKVTGHYAWYLTTDESRFTEITDNQLNLFNNK
jgi:hypothetical protein